MYEDDDAIFAAIYAGARGYLLKGVDQEEVLRSIKAVSSGEAIFSKLQVASRAEAIIRAHDAGLT